MKIRGFYQTADGDEVPVDFNYEEEKQAFDTALDKLKFFTGAMKNCRYAMAAGHPDSSPTPGAPSGLSVAGTFVSTDEDGRVFVTYRTPQNEKPMLTTLQAEQTSWHSSILQRILGLHVANVHSRTGFNLCLYTDLKWEDEKWVSR